MRSAGLGAALRAAAAIAGANVSVDVRASTSTPPEVVSTVYVCCRAALGHTRATITVREVENALAQTRFERLATLVQLYRALGGGWQLPASEWAGRDRGPEPSS